MDEQAAQMNIQHLAPVLNGMTVAIYLLNRKRKVLFANHAAEALFGKAAPGMDFVQIIRHPDCLSALDKVLGRTAQAEATFELLQPVRTSYHVTASALNPGDKSHDIPRAIVSLENVSHIREAEQMRSEFVANVSHELRSPLTALTGFIETLQTAAKDDAAARERFLDIMSREANRMDRLIGDLLSLSSVEARKHIRPQNQVRLGRIVERAMAILAGPSGKTEGLMTLHQPSDLNDLVYGDEDQLLQVVLNLLENALKYGSSERGVDIGLSNPDHAVGIDGAPVALTVTDYGEGIAPEHLSRLTERFYRVDNSRSRQKGGTGLGMAIVKHILTRHHGQLKIDSTVGKGSRFTVLLPLVDLPISDQPS